MAYEIGYDIIADDQACSAIMLEYGTRAEKFEDILTRYTECIERVLENGIIGGDTADKLKLFLESVRTLEEEAGDIAELAKKLAGSFITDMDTADNCLF